MNNALIIDEKDNVAVALTDLSKGDKFNNVTLLSDIPQKHKFALTDVKKGEAIIKYGSPIGIAKENISAGDHVHTHNLKTAISDKDSYTFSGNYDYISNESNLYFNGFLRDDGNVGIRNRIFIIPTVGCANNAAKEIAQKASMNLGLEDNTICAFPHPYGCSQLGSDAENTSKCLAALCKHPNAGGALLISLGCENNNLEVMSHYLGEYNHQRIRTLNMQECDDEILDGVRAVEKIYEITKNDKRTKQPLNKLTVGFKCGGSDGFSGITANPLCGKLCDKLTSEGAKVILTEVPEMFGAEKLLLERSANKNVFDACVSMINSFKKHFTDHGQVVYENPSPGNKTGGITTLEEKSLGCITKGGFSAVTNVLNLYDPCKKDGLSLLWGPGNDIVSTTNMTCANATMILFTTGRGTPLGAPVPTVKISTNSELAHKKRAWIDFDAGILLNGADFSQATKKLFDLIIAVANGEKTLNEKHNYEEIAVFKDGITL